MRMGLRTKLILAIGLPLLVVYFVMIGTLVDQIRSRGLKRLEERAEEQATEAAARIGARLALAVRSVENLADLHGALPESAADEIYIYSESLMEREPLIHELRLFKAGQAPPAWAEAALRTGKPQWTEPYQEENSGTLLAACVIPILRGSETAGAIRAGFLLDDLRNDLGAPGLSMGDYALVSHEGRFLVKPSLLASTSESLPEILQRQKRSDLMTSAKDLLRGKTGLIQTEGLLKPERQWIAFTPVPGTPWFFIGAVPESTVLAFSQRQLHLALAILGVGLAVILGLHVFMTSRITRPLARLAEGVAGLGAGNLDVRVSGVESHDEIGDLAAAFNRMVADLKAHVQALGRETAAREKVEGEIRVARQIQTALLPRTLPHNGAFDLHAINLPARRVAGDFYDCFFRDDRTLVFLIADVSGKGVPAALFMAVARTVLRDVLASDDSLVEAVTRANLLLEKDSPGSMYVTLFAGRYDPASGALRYVNGGHPPPYRLDAAGGVTPFGEVGGPMVGLLSTSKYEEGAGVLEKGDRLVLFTDGVPEASDAAGEFFGEQRFMELLIDGKDDDATGLCKRISERLEAYQAGNRYDDLTLLVLARRA